MKFYIKADSTNGPDPITMLNYLLGFSSYDSIVERRLGDHRNYALVDRMYRLTDDFINKYKPKLKSIGAKYINPNRSLGVMYFYIDEDKLKAQYDAAKAEAKRKKEEVDAKLMEKLNAIDIDKYKPDASVLKKLADYRDRGSKVNVKAIKDTDKLLKYYYGASILDWGDLAGSIYEILSKDWRAFDSTYRDILQAIDRRVEKDDQYQDSRSEMDQKLGLKNSGNLFTYEDKNCWLPKSIMNFFVDNNIPVHFKKRTAGSQWDRNGRQWSEIEHLLIYPDSANPIEYDIVVHTDEGGSPARYTGFGPNGRTDERTSAADIIKDLTYVLEHQ